MDTILEILDIVADMYAVFDSEFTVIYANKKWKDVNSVESGKKADIGSNLLELYQDERAIQIQNLFNMVKNSDTNRVNTDVKFGDSIFDIIYTKLETGQISLVARDITKHTLSIEKSTIEKNVINQFLSRTSHELRTPLNSILGFSELISMETINDKITEYNSYIAKSGKIMLHLVDDLLLLTKIKQNTLLIDLDCINVTPIINEVIILMENMAKERKIHITCELASSHYLKIDKFRYSQIVLNLLSNAIKYNRECGTINIRMDKNILKIKDSGIGINKDYLETVTKPFRRINSNIEGSGIGLSLVTELCKLMEGEFYIDSEYGQWTEVSISFPMCEVEEKSIPLEPDVEYVYTIVYIEDNMINHILMRNIVARMKSNIKIIEATQGRIGIDLVKHHNPDVVLLDMHLPDIDGDVIMDNLRKWKPDIKVIIISADDSIETKKRMKMRGISEYVPKPIDTSLMMKLIEKNI